MNTMNNVVLIEKIMLYAMLQKPTAFDNYNRFKDILDNSRCENIFFSLDCKTYQRVPKENYFSYVDKVELMFKISKVEEGYDFVNHGILPSVIYYGVYVKSNAIAEQVSEFIRAFYPGNEDKVFDFYAKPLVLFSEDNYTQVENIAELHNKPRYLLNVSDIQNILFKKNVGQIQTMINRFMRID